MHEEKRIHLRKALQTEGWLADTLGNTWAPIKLLDISLGGIAFIGEEALTVDSSRIFRFHLPNDGRLIKFVGRIANCHAHQYLAGFRIGAQFTRIDNNDLTLIQQFIDRAPAPA